MDSLLKNKIWKIAGVVFLLLYFVAILPIASSDNLIEALPWLIISVFCFIQSKAKIRASTQKVFKKIKSKMTLLWADKLYKWHLISILAFTIIGVFLLLGMPGAIIYEFYHFIVNLIFGENTISSLSGDSGWPIAIVITVIWPWGFLIALNLTQRLKTSNKIAKYLLYGLFIIIWGGIIIWVFTQ